MRSVGPCSPFGGDGSDKSVFEPREMCQNVCKLFDSWHQHLPSWSFVKIEMEVLMMAGVDKRIRLPWWILNKMK